MIRINLLGTPKPKRGKRGGGVSVPSLPSEGPSILLVLIIVGLLTAGGNYFYWWKLNKEQTKLKSDLQAAELRIKQLSQVKAAYLEKENQHAALKRRFDVIDQLRANQAGPVNLLNMVSNTVNSTDAVWLLAMKDEGNNITIEGVTLSNTSLANLMENIRKTGFFKNVELKETAQDNIVKDMQSFTFTLVCEKQQQQKA